MRKIFVLRPNSLLSSKDSTMRFGNDNVIVIPIAVLEELQKFHGKPEKQKIARQILEYLDSFDTRKLLREGVVQANGSLLRLAHDYSEIDVGELKDISEFDKRCFQTCLGLISENSETDVILVSKNPALRIKAKILGIKAETFRDDTFPALAEQYSGRIEITLPGEVIDQFYAENSLDINQLPLECAKKLVTNMFIIGKSQEGTNQSLLGRFNGKRIIPLEHKNAYPSGIKPLNVGQKLMLECLMTSWEEAPLVILKGDAGTGKTFCSLAVGLDEVDKNVDGLYKQILVAAPFETVGQERMGFLPGDIREKASPYLGGIKDNLSNLRGSKPGGYGGKSKGYAQEAGEYYFDKGLVQIQPIGFLRGRTITDTFFIIDETQNVDPSDLKPIVTRAAKGSKFIFLGDPSQVDNPKLDEHYNGLVYISEIMKGNPLCWQVTLDDSESVRGELARVAARLL